MTTMTETATQAYQLFIKATPEAIWEAITTPESTARYFHGTTSSRRSRAARRRRLPADDVVHDRLEGAPKTAEGVSGTGWMHLLSGLKTLVATGEPLFG